jgi:prolyl oligopeptidase
MSARFAYPAARRALYTYTMHGRTIQDPYHWLEDPDADETKAFVTGQNKVFESYLADFKHREDMRKTIEAMQNYPRSSPPSKRGGKFYYFHNTGLQNQSVLMRQDTLDGGADAKSDVFLDVNKLSEEGTSGLGSTAWSKSERYYAHAISEKGSDWASIHVRDATTGENTPDVIDWVKFSGIAWLRDEGFFYTRFPKPASGRKEETGVLENCAVYFHRLGTNQDADVVVLDCPEHAKWLLSVEVSDCDGYAVVSVHDGCEPHNLIWVADLPEDFSANPRRLDVAKVLDTFEAEYSYLSNDDTSFYLLTTKDAPLKRIVTYDVKAKSFGTELVKETEAKIDFCAVVADTLLVGYLEDVKHVLYRRQLTAVNEPLKKFDLPIGSITGMHARRQSPFVSIGMSSFLLPNRSFYFDINTPDDVKVFRDSKVEGFDPDDFETKQVFVDSSDGAKVPMFVCHRKGIELDGSNPTLLYGYGGFNISLTPSFSASRIVFLSRLGGVLAVANIRGGGEYGEKWHQAGAKFQKQNCYVDFINCAKYLQANKYTSREKLAMMGGSNGGLLVAAVANRAPHLFKALVCQVGVLDLYKFHKFTIGHAWTSDFGDPEVEADFDYITEYSPIHNVKVNTTYPAVLVATADHDDRVVPAHSLKYLASLQHANPESGPFLGRIEVNAGHGAAKPTSKVIAEAADTYSFLACALGATWKQ